MKINKDQTTVSRLKKLKFDLKRGSGHIPAYLMNRFRWHYYPRFVHVSHFPNHVDVEISSVCNMRCPMCYTITDEFKRNVKKEFMELGLFKKIIDECVKHKAYSIRISLRGEPFLNKDAVTMIRYAKENGIKEVSALTNNLALTPGLFRQVMEAGLDWLTISFDGLNEVYESIRMPAKFAESYEKIRTYKDIKNKARSWKPVIKIQTVWPAIKDCAQEYFDAFNPYVDDIAINALIDYLHRDKETDIVYAENFTCPVLYQRLAIGSDGMVPLCSNDAFCLHPIGDANRDSIFAMWHGERLNKARQIHRDHKATDFFKACKECYLPRETQSVVENIGRKEVTIDKYINRPDRVGE